MDVSLLVAVDEYVPVMVANAVRACEAVLVPVPVTVMIAVPVCVPEAVVASSLGVYKLSDGNCERHNLPVLQVKA